MWGMFARRTKRAGNRRSASADTEKENSERQKRAKKIVLEMKIKPPKFKYKARLTLDNVFVDSENERQTYYEWSFFGLRESIKRKGVITPIGVELLKNGGYKVIYGNRRVLASKSLKRRTIKAKAYYNLTEEQRYEMQVAENATKVKIPLTETAENLWEYYKFLLEKESKEAYPLEELGRYRTYWGLPKEARRTFSMANLARRTGFSEDKVGAALRYVNLNRSIKERVEKGKFSYSFAQELGRISDRNEQNIFLKRVLEGQKIRNKDQLAAAVRQYLGEKKKSEKDFVLESSKVSRKNNHDLEQRLKEATKIIGNLAALATVDPEIIKMRSNGAKATIADYFKQTKKKVKTIKKSLRVFPEYKRVLERLGEQNKSLRERILEGEFNGKGEIKDYLMKVEYQIVSVDLVYEDKSQPRKTFDEKELDNLAETIKRVGLLSPILVKQNKKGRYRIVVGHRRAAAVRKAGLKKIEVLVCDLDDQLCREIQYEEDIFEKVILSERAEKLYQMYLLKKKKAASKRKELTLRGFAQEYAAIGAQTIINALIFASLPKQVKLMHEKGLLHYSTGIAIGNELERYKGLTGRKLRKKEEKEWIIDWAIESSLLGYKAKILQEKVFESIYQRSFEDFSPGVLGGGEGKKYGRRRLAAIQVKESLSCLPEVRNILKREVGKKTLEVITGFVGACEETTKIITSLSR